MDVVHPRFKGLALRPPSSSARIWIRGKSVDPYGGISIEESLTGPIPLDLRACVYMVGIGLGWAHHV